MQATNARASRGGNAWPGAAVSVGSSAAAAAMHARRSSTAAATRMALQGSRMSWLTASVKVRSASSTLRMVRMSRHTRNSSLPAHMPEVWHQMVPPLACKTAKWIAHA